MDHISINIELLFNDFNKNLEANKLNLALISLQKVDQILKSFSANHVYRGYFFINLSCYYNNVGDLDKATEHLQNAKKIALKNPKYSDHLIAEILNASSRTMYNRGEYKNALDILEEANVIFKRLGEKLKIAENKILQGNILLETDDKWETGIRFLSEGLLIAKQNKDAKLEIKALIDLGRVFNAHRFLYLAIDQFRQAQVISMRNNFVTLNNQILYFIANSYIFLHNLDKVDEIISTIEKQASEDQIMKMELNNLKYYVANQRMNFIEALTHASNLSEFYHEVGDMKGITESELKKAYAYYNLRDFKYAIRFGKTALNMSKEIGNRLIMAEAQNLLNEIENGTGNTYESE